MTDNVLILPVVRIERDEDETMNGMDEWQKRENERLRRLPVETEVRAAINAWLDCPGEKRPSPEALGRRIAEIVTAFSSFRKNLTRAT